MNKGIHQLRGICAVIVYLGHVFAMMPNYVWNNWGASVWHLAFDGQCAVYIFFAITGFFSYYEGNIDMKTYGKRLTHAAKKIYPPHILLLLIAFAICNNTFNYDKSLFTEWSNSFWQETISVKELLAQMVIFLPHNPDLLNPPTWYLNVQIKAILLLPVAVLIMNKTRWYLLLPLLFISFVWNNSIVNIWHLFLIAAFAKKNWNFVEKILTIRWALIFVACISICMLNIKNEFNIQVKPLCSLCQAIGAAGIVSVTFFLNKDYSIKIFDYLGTISYEFYLTHFVVLLALRTYVDNVYQLLLGSFLISLFISHIVHFYITNKIAQY